MHSQYISIHETMPRLLLTCNFHASTCNSAICIALAQLRPTQVFLQMLLAQVTFARNFQMYHRL